MRRTEFKTRLASLQVGSAPIRIMPLADQFDALADALVPAPEGDKTPGLESQSTQAGYSDLAEILFDMQACVESTNKVTVAQYCRRIANRLRQTVPGGLISKVRDLARDREIGEVQEAAQKAMDADFTQSSMEDLATALKLKAGYFAEMSKEMRDTANEIGGAYLKLPKTFLL